MVKNFLKKIRASIFRIEVCGFLDGYHLSEKLPPSSKYYLNLKKKEEIYPKRWNLSTRLKGFTSKTPFFEDLQRRGT